jgi:ABC-type Fe3+/spermidine/putrescine transport system ATPase subunit
MSFLKVDNLIKTYGSFHAVDNVNIDVERGQVCSFLGPSGCGKTTTLRCIAGLEQADSGRISLGGRTLFSSDDGTVVAPEDRDLGMVFQSYALWPHKTIEANLSLGLRIKGMPNGEIRDRVEEMLALVGMAGVGKRFPASLSGGQQQRVALARAMALQPKCILFDEPLSNLDLLLREKMRFEIRELLVKIGITAVYVTHDQTEAMVISDHIVVLNKGRIEREGPPAEVYNYPRDRFTAEFLGRTNIVPLDRKNSDPGAKVVTATNGVTLNSLDAGRLEDRSESGEFVIAFRPESLVITDEKTSAENCMPAKVVESQYLGSTTQIVLDIGQGLLATAVVLGDQSRAAGSQAYVSVEPRNVLILRDRGGIAPAALGAA